MPRVARQMLGCPVSSARVSCFPARSAWGRYTGRPTQKQRCTSWASSSQRREMGVVVECLLSLACALLGVCVL